MEIQGVFFDFDGTLANTLPVCVQAFQEALLQINRRSYAPEEITIHFGPSEEGVLAALVPPARLPEALDIYLRAYRTAHRVCPRPFDGVLELLEFLKESDVRTAIVTGKGALSADISFELLGIEPYLDHVETGSPAGAEKPAALLRAATRLGLDPANVIYAGDHPYDLQSAAEVGMLGVGAGWAQTAAVHPGSNGQNTPIFTTVRDFERWLRSAITPPFSRRG